jgi:hypothetical protein
MRILKENEKVTIDKLDFYVTKDGNGRYYLELKKVLGISNDTLFNDYSFDKKSLQFCVLGYNLPGRFPVCKTLEDLTLFAEAILKEVDKKILERKELENNVLLDGNLVKIERDSHGFYLLASHVFDKYGIDKHQSQEAVLGYRDCKGYFPFCKTLEDLKKYVSYINTTISFNKTSRDKEIEILAKRIECDVPSSSNIIMDFSPGGKYHWQLNYPAEVFSSEKINRYSQIKQMLILEM